MKNEMPTARIIISDDGLLDAYPVDRQLPSFLSRDVFNNNVRNKKPVIIDGAALRWLGMSEEGATPEFDMDSIRWAEFSTEHFMLHKIRQSEDWNEINTWT
jgi:hypothetical protein